LKLKKKRSKKSGPKFFISYSTEDLDLFDIPHVVWNLFNTSKQQYLKDNNGTIKS